MGPYFQEGPISDLLSFVIPFGEPDPPRLQNALSGARAKEFEGKASHHVYLRQVREAGVLSALFFEPTRQLLCRLRLRQEWVNNKGLVVQNPYQGRLSR